MINLITICSHTSLLQYHWCCFLWFIISHNIHFLIGSLSLWLTSPQSCWPQPLVTTILFSVFMNPAFSDSIYRWYHKLFVFLWLDYLRQHNSQHNFLKVSLCCSNGKISFFLMALRKLDTAFHSGFIYLYSHQWCTSVLFSPNRHQHFLSLIILMTVILTGTPWTQLSMHASFIVQSALFAN